MRKDIWWELDICVWRSHPLLVKMSQKVASNVMHRITVQCVWRGIDWWMQTVKNWNVILTVVPYVLTRIRAWNVSSTMS